MRNIKEYPITHEEKVKALQWAIEQAEHDANKTFGGTTLAALNSIMVEIATSGDVKPLKSNG